MNAPWEFQFLGRISARYGEQTITRFSSSRVAALLARLALYPHRDHPREELIDLLWPDSDLDAGRLNLRVALASLRRQLEPPEISPGSVLLADRSTIRLRFDSFRCDVLDFESALKSAGHAVSVEQKYRALDQAVALYAGELLPGFYDEWVLEERERLNACYEDAAEQQTALPETAFFHPALPAMPADSAPVLTGFPLEWTRFFGREAETAEIVRRLLDPETRLVTLSGPGGSGKTRLAGKTARLAAAHFSGPVCFVSLADLSDAALIPDAAASALALPRSAAAAPLDRIAAHLSALPPALLVFDNFEHLVERGALLLFSLLSRVPTLTCLVTSRRRLALPGEVEFPVLPLPLPEENGSAGEIARASSVQLFTDRAQAARPDFQITPHNAPAVAALCRTLEGIPLALELAAARCSALTPALINERLLKRFELLTSRRGDKGGRHRSLWAALSLSFEMLSPDLQRFFTRLSVFRGGWTADAAEAVCEEPAALEYLTQLRERSLTVIAEAPNEMRFRLLETLREFAAEQLSIEEKDTLARRHADWYGQMAKEAEVQLTKPDQAVWLERMEADHDNLRLALGFRLAADEASEDDTGAAFTLCAGLWRFWSVRGYHRAAGEWMAQALARPGGPAEPRARAANGAGNLAYVRSDYPAAEAFYTEALAIMRGLDWKTAIASCLCNLGMVATARGEYAHAQTLQADSLALWRETDSVRGAAFTLQCQGVTAQHLGDNAQARRLHEESLALWVTLDDDEGRLWTLANLAAIANEEGDRDKAAALLAQALSLCVKLHDLHALHALLAQTADLAADPGDWARAARLQSASEAVRQRSGAGLSPKDAADREARRAEVRTILGAAEYETQWALGAALTDEQAIALAQG